MTQHFDEQHVHTAEDVERFRRFQERRQAQMDVAEILTEIFPFLKTNGGSMALNGAETILDELHHRGYIVKHRGPIGG